MRRRMRRRRFNDGGVLVINSPPAWSFVGTLTSYAASSSYISSTVTADSIVDSQSSSADACASPNSTNWSSSSGRFPSWLLCFLNDSSTSV